MSLRKECKAAILAALKDDGLPPITDKCYNSIWEAFAKTQPSSLSASGRLISLLMNSTNAILTISASSTGQLVDSDVWGNLSKCIEKFLGVDKKEKYATKVVAGMKKKFKENPTQAEIKAFMT